MDQEFLWKLRDDNKSALKELFDSFYTDLTRFALRLTADSMVAEEIVQDIFVYLWQNRHSIDIKSSVEAYLYRAVKNKCINFVRSKVHLKNKITGNEEDMQHLWVHPNHLESDELPVLIGKAIKSLPVQTSLIFTLSRNSGLSYSEIAERLNVSQKTVEYHMSSALKSIKKFLTTHGYIFLLALLCWRY